MENLHTSLQGCKFGRPATLTQDKFHGNVFYMVNLNVYLKFPLDCLCAPYITNTKRKYDETL